MSLKRILNDGDDDVIAEERRDQLFRLRMQPEDPLRTYYPIASISTEDGIRQDPFFESEFSIAQIGPEIWQENIGLNDVHPDVTDSYMINGEDDILDLHTSENTTQYSACTTLPSTQATSAVCLDMANDSNGTMESSSPTDNEEEMPVEQICYGMVRTRFLSVTSFLLTREQAL